MRRVLAAALVVALALSFAACTNRRVIYERRTPVYLDTPQPDDERDWSVSGTATPETTPAPGNEGDVLPFEFTGYAYCVMNAGTGEILLGSNTTTRNYIASITKLMTVLTALDWLPVNDNVKIGEGWLDFMKQNSGIDSFGLTEGTTCKVKDLISMALVRSFGDAAIVLGKAVEERSGRSMIDLMNAKARTFGMTETHFDNVIGLDIGNDFTANYSTALDAAKLMQQALRSEVVMQACCGKDIRLSDGKVLDNTSAFLRDTHPGSNYTVLGGKTGYTKAAGSNLAVAASSNITGTVFVVVYLHGAGMNTIGNEIDLMLEYLIAKEAAK